MYIHDGEALLCTVNLKTVGCRHVCVDSQKEKKIVEEEELYSQQLLRRLTVYDSASPHSKETSLFRGVHFGT